MKKRYALLLTPDQEKLLNEKTEALGFAKKSEYIRFMIFMESSFLEKIDQIHKEVCQNVGKSKKKE